MQENLTSSFNNSNSDQLVRERQTELERRGINHCFNAPVTCANAINEGVVAGFGDGRIGIFRPGLFPEIKKAHKGAILCIAADDDFVLTGGEAAAAILTDCIVRLIPGVISDETSALTDSFQDNLLAYPIYTRPSEYKGMKVPKVLLSGNQKAINQWREEESLRRTQEKRPDLLD